MSPSKNKYIFAISEKSLFFILGFFVVVVLVHFNRETLIEAVAYIFYCYANDTKLYLSIMPDDTDTQLVKLTGLGWRN